MTINSIKLLGLSILVFSTMAAAQTEETPLTPVLVCRAQQCAEARYSMTKGFLYNKIAQMMKKNENKDVLICEADPFTHVCLSEGIVIQANTAFDTANISIDKLTLNNVKLVPDSSLDLVFDHKIRANKTFPNCQLGISKLTVNNTNDVELLTQDFNCDITETGNTSVNATYEINYLDFDYGFMGAYYTIGIGESITGDKSGYALMRFTERVPLTKTAPNIELGNAHTTITLPPIVEQTQATTDTSVEIQTKTLDVPPPVQVEQRQTLAATPAIIQEVGQPKTTITKTTTVEKMVINSDGSRQVEPPETRTIIEELKK